jgi:DNA-binding NarL/FixJ family response regulator
MTPSKPRTQNVTSKLNKIINHSQNISTKLDKLNKKIDVLIIIELAKSGLNLKEVADTLGVSEDTIERMVPFRKLKPKSGKE